MHYNRAAVFGKCWESCNYGVNVIVQKYVEGGGRVGRTSMRQLEFYFDASLFVIRFFVSFSLSLCFPFLLHLRELEHGRNIVGLLHYLFVCVCICLFNVRLLYDHICAGREKY